MVDHLLRATPESNPAAWEITVFADEQANAFALPGGKIGVYSGLLDVAENQYQLATVVGHEIVHVIAQHSNERVSTSFVADTRLQVVQIVGGTSSPARNQLYGLLGLGAQVGVLLPCGRVQKSEADLVGLDLMAKAGFDPRESVRPVVILIADSPAVAWLTVSFKLRGWSLCRSLSKGCAGR